MVGGDGTIDVKIVTAGRSATASPGDELDVVVTITDPNSGTPLSEGEAEVAIVAVDEAFLYLTPNPLPKLNDTMIRFVSTFPPFCRITTHLTIWSRRVDTHRRWMLGTVAVQQILGSVVRCG